jgi:hypothetical protein
MGLERTDGFVWFENPVDDVCGERAADADNTDPCPACGRGYGSDGILVSVFIGHGKDMGTMGPIFVAG